jgi:arginyl-tRNA synthetase
VNIFNYFKAKIIKELKTLAKNHNIIIDETLFFKISFLKNKSLGDITTNAAFIYANYLNLTAYKLAQDLTAALDNDNDILLVTAANNGFINITLTKDFWINELVKILQNNIDPVDISIYKQLQIDVKRNYADLNFDVSTCQDLAASNLGFYLPYTYAKTCMILNNASEIFPQLDLHQPIDSHVLSHLNDEYDLLIIKTLTMWPNVVEKAIFLHDSQKIMVYLQNLANYFHNALKKSRVISNNKYIIETNFKLTYARCLLAKAIKLVIGNAFLILDIPTQEKI